MTNAFAKLNRELGAIRAAGVHNLDVGKMRHILDALVIAIDFLGTLDCEDADSAVEAMANELGA